MLTKEQIDEILSYYPEFTVAADLTDINTSTGIVLYEAGTLTNQQDTEYAVRAWNNFPALAAEYKAMLAVVEAARKMQDKHCLGSCSGAMCSHCALNPIREALAAMEGGVT